MVVCVELRSRDETADELLGESEVLARDIGRVIPSSLGDGVNQFPVLQHRCAPYLVRVGLGPEVEADPGSEVDRKVDEDRVVRRFCDRSMEPRVCLPGGIVVGCVEVGLKRNSHGCAVFVGAALGCRAGDQWLEKCPGVEELLEFGPIGHEVASNPFRGGGPLVGQHEVTSVTTSTHF